MPRPAKVLAPADVRRLLKHVDRQRYPQRNRVMILLSFKAGLRACEMSGLQWPMILGPTGKVGASIEVADFIAKKGSGRRIPLHPELASALVTLHLLEGRPAVGPVLRSERSGKLTARSVVNWFAATYAELNLAGCSSHSGRRTFITQAARVIARTGGSLRDIQELAGHRSITTTERYIEGDRDAQRRLIKLL